MITQSRLKELLHYDPETGVFTWLVSKGAVRVGKTAGSYSSGGYRAIYIDSRAYGAHRLAFLYMTGGFPKAQIDHINGVRDDNRWSNLRVATQSQNSVNAKLRSDNCAGYKGVRWCDSHQKWATRLSVDGKARHLGYFDTPEEAHAVYVAAAKQYHGEFARAA